MTALPVPAPVTAAGLSILRACTGRYATKRFHRRRNGTVGKTSYGNEKWFAVAPAAVGDIHELAALLDRLQRDPHAFIIRGALLPDTNPTRTRRLLHPDPEDHHPATFAAVPRRWLALDFDGIPAPAATDPADDPEGAVEYLIGLLPAEFQDASCWWQWTSSQGFKPGLNGRLWFWLDRPVDDADLTRWAQAVNAVAGCRLIDPALLRPVQPHYVAAPIFDGVPDPLPRRSGFRHGLDDVVALVVPEPKAVALVTDGSGAGFHSTAGFENHVAAIGSPEVGFNNGIYRAICSYVWTHGDDTDTAALKARLKQAVLDAPAGTRSAIDIARYASDHYLDAEIRRVLARKAAEAPAPAPAEPAGMPFYPDAAVPLAEAERRTHDAVVAFLARAMGYVPPIGDEPAAGPPVEALRIGVAVGKTEETLDLLAVPALAAESLLYLLPEHALADEVAERFTAKSLTRGGPRGIVIRGRDRIHPSGEPMCRKADLAAQVAAMGRPVLATLCHRKAHGRRPEEFCEHHPARGGSCRYIAQLQDTGPGVRLMPHQHAFLPLPEGMPKPRLTVLDEAFWQASVRGVDGPLNSRPFIRAEDLRCDGYVLDNGKVDYDQTDELRTLARRAADILEAGEISPRAFLAAGFTTADVGRAKGLEYACLPDIGITPSMPAAAQRRHLGVATAQLALKRARFWKVLGDELQHAPGRDRFNGLVPGSMTTDAGPVAGFFLRWSADLAKHIREAPVLVLDATADATILQRFLPHLGEPLAIEAAWPHVEVIQAADTVSPKCNFVPRDGDSVEEARRKANHRENLRRLTEVEVARAGGPRPDGSPAVLAVSYKRAVLEEDDKTPRIQPVPGADLAWLNGVRGKDRWRGVATLVVAGRTQPNAADVEAITAALFYRDPEPIGTVDGPRFPKVPRAYRMADGSARAVEADVHPDRRVEAVRWQLNEAELVQVIGRGRPARRTADRPLRVVLATSVPLPVTVTRLVKEADILPDVVEVMAARGAVPSVLGDIADAYPDLLPSREAAKKALQRAKLTGDKPLYGISIGVCPQLADARNRRLNPSSPLGETPELRTIGYRRCREGKRAVTGTLAYDARRIDPTAWLAEHLPGAVLIAAPAVSAGNGYSQTACVEPETPPPVPAAEVPPEPVAVPAIPAPEPSIPGPAAEAPPEPPAEGMVNLTIPSKSEPPAVPPLWPFGADRDDDPGWLLPDALARAAARWLRSIGLPGSRASPVAALPQPLACLKPDGGFREPRCH